MEFDIKTLDFGKDETTITALGLKSWFYREVENWTYSKIAKELDVDSRNVPSYVKRFKENYRAVLQLTSVLGEAPLVPKVKREQDVRAKIAKRRKEGMHWGSVARGLEVVDGKLVASKKNLEDVKLVKDLFKDADDGKGLGQLSRDFKLSKRIISYMLKNRNYRHLIVDPLQFDRVQEKIKEWTYHQQLPYAVLSYDGNGDPVWDEEKKKEMMEAINDRAGGKSWREIAKKRGWPIATAKKRIINPVYCGMRWSDGKLVKAHNRRIVKVKIWRAASKAKAPIKGGLFKKGLEEDNRNKVLASFNTGNDKLGMTTEAIRESTGLSRSCVKKHLKKLEKGKFVVNDPPFWRRKF